MEYHPIFARMKAMETTIEVEFSLDNKGKELVFKEVMLLKYKIFHDNLKELAKATDACIKNCPGQECNAIYNRNIEVFERSIHEYNMHFQSNQYTQDERKCFEVVLEKFNKWHSQRVIDTKEAIEWICNNKFYTDCRTVQSIIFDWYIGAFVGTLTDADKTLNDINGDLKGLRFKGVRI
jgi:hypothetical protein